MDAYCRRGRIPVGETSLAYAVYGHGPVPLVLIPGLSAALADVSSPLTAWTTALGYRALAKGYTVYLFGRADDVTSGTTIRDMANQLALALTRLHVTDACVLGVSQGGMIAQWLALDHPELVRALVLAVTTGRSGESVRRFADEQEAFIRAGDHGGLLWHAARFSYSPRHLRLYRLFRPFLGLVGRPKSYDRYLHSAAACVTHDALLPLSRLTVPTLILGGEEDRIVTAEASRLLAATIPGARCYLYPGLGHGAFEEAKDFLLRARTFFDEHQ